MSNGINAPQGLQIVESAIGNGGTQKLKTYRIYASADGTATLPLSIFSGDPVKRYPAGVYNAGPNTNGLIPQLGTIVPAYTPAAVNAQGQSTAPATPVLGAFLGIFISCTYYNPQFKLLSEVPYWPASQQVAAGTPIIAYVNDDPEVVFRVQVSTSTANTVIAAQQMAAGGALTPSTYQSIFDGQNANLGIGGTPFTNPAAPLTPANNPPGGNTANGISAYYLDGSSITLANANAGNPNFDVNIIGVAPQVGTQIGLNSSPYNAALAGLIPGVNMPFIELLCKFNNNVGNSIGVPGTFFTNHA